MCWSMVGVQKWSVLGMNVWMTGEEVRNSESQMRASEQGVMREEKAGGGEMEKEVCWRKECLKVKSQK